MNDIMFSVEPVNPALSVGLVCFVSNLNNPINYFVLLEKIKDSYRIPQTPLLSDKSSYNYCRDLINAVFRVKGTWIDMMSLRLAGVFDEPGRVSYAREILIAYSLYLPDKTSISPNYEWIKLDQLNNINICDDNESIIRYTGTLRDYV